jgi:hypothetical protein
LLSRQFLRAWIDVNCPACGFPMEIQLIDAWAQASRWCPCCRRLIHFVEPDASLSSGLAAADRAVERLRRSLNRMGR